MKKNALIYLILFFGPFAALLLAFFNIREDNPFFVALLIATVIACFTVLWARYQSLLRFLREVSSALTRVSNQDFPQTLIPTSHSEFIPVTRALQAVAVNMSLQISDLIREKNQLKAVLDGMVEGVLVTDERDGILLANSAAQSMLGMGGSWQGKTVLERTRNHDLHEMIRRVQSGQQPDDREMAVYSDKLTRHLKAHAAPVWLGPGRTGCVSVLADITELKRLENVRKEFVANVSHELKTPLTNILGYTETLRGGGLADARMAPRFLEKIEGNSLQLKNLVEDILKLSEIESGRFALKRETVRLREFLDEILPPIREAAAGKRIRLVEQIAPGFPALSTDAKALRQILCNLLDNAVKYTPEGGQVTFAAGVSGDFAEFTVQDTGIGIQERDLERVFERFYRVDAARSRSIGGTGLGLSIVKHLTAELGGEVRAESELGKGSRFFFRLPLSAPNPRKASNP